MDMFHMVFSGPEQQSSDFIAALISAGYPAALDRTGKASGLPLEPLVDLIEVLGDGDLDEPLEIAKKYGCQLRLHGWVNAPELDGSLEERVTGLETLLNALLLAQQLKDN